MKMEMMLLWNYTSIKFNHKHNIKPLNFGWFFYAHKSNTMKIDFIPFQIGEQYENWEFDLEPVKTTKTYDQYKYLKADQKELFNVPIKQILLTFNLDILFQVEYQFESKYFQQLKSRLIEYLTTGTFRDYGNRLEWENGEICLFSEVKEYTKLYMIDKKFLDYY